MSVKNDWCEPGKSTHPNCPDGYVYFGNVAEIEEGFDLGHSMGFDKVISHADPVYDDAGNLLHDRKAVFVSKKEWLEKGENDMS